MPCLRQDIDGPVRDGCLALQSMDDRLCYTPGEFRFSRLRTSSEFEPKPLSNLQVGWRPAPMLPSMVFREPSETGAASTCKDPE